MTPHITVVTSVTAALNLMGMGSAQWLLLGYTGLSWAADACETMILSYLGPSAACFWPETVGPAQESILTSIVFAGMLVGVYSLGAAADALGRRKGFLLSALLLGGAGLASAAAPSFWTLLALRAVVGFALGGTPIAVTLFAEWVPPARRGFLLLLQQSAWTVGTMLEACLAWAVLPTLGWRWLLGLSAVPMLLLLAAYPLLPESPYWLCAKGRHQEAEGEVLKMADCGAAQGERTWTVRFSTENDHLTESSSDSATPEGLPEDEGSSRRRSSCTAGSTSAGGGSLKQRLVASAQGALGHLFSPELRVTTSLLWGIW